MTLDSIGSYQLPISEPAEIPESTRTCAPVGLVKRHDPTAGRKEAAHRILGVHPCFNRVSERLDILRGERQRLTGRNADLLCDQIEPRHHLRDRVLDLQAGVHLQEEELVRAGRPRR